MRKQRPRIKPKLSATDILFEIAGWTAVLTFWIYTLASYDRLPDTIPIHYNAKGQADGFGEKSIIMYLPLVATILYVLMTVINKFPRIFNYPVKITQENALHQYTSATRLIRYLKLALVLVFGMIVSGTVRHAAGNADGLGSWFLSLAMVILFAPILYYVVTAMPDGES